MDTNLAHKYLQVPAIASKPCKTSNLHRIYKHLREFTTLFEEFTKIYVIYNVNCSAPPPFVTGLLSYSRAVHVLRRRPMDNRVAGCQPPTGATPLLRFGLPSPLGVVGMVMAPGSASRKHPFYVVCRCGLGCCVCGGRRVGVGAWGRGPLVMLHVRALFVGGGGCV